MECIECVICLNDIASNDRCILTCCKNDVHYSCLNDWINKNTSKKNIAKCFICSQENSIIENIVATNKYQDIVIDYETTNSITNRNNNININNEIILYNDNNMLTVSYNIDKRLYYLYISVKLTFLIFVSTTIMFVLYFTL
jgi:hypothetical protein